MASVVQLTSLGPIIHSEVDQMMECNEPQLEGHDGLGPVVAFSDLLELGADCTVLGDDDYIHERDVFEHGIVAQHQFEDDPHNNSNNHHNNNSVWFSDVDDSDFSSILNNVDTFSFGENIFFDDDNDSANCIVTSSSCDVSSSSHFSSSDVVINRDAVTNLFHCPHCEKSFQYSSRLQRHLSVHQSKQYKCKICDKYFSRIDVLETHVARTHSASSTSLSSSSSSSPSNSSSEVDDWSPVKRSVKITSQHFACSQCPSVLSSRHHLERHEMSHRNKVGHFECPHCKKSFSVKHKYQMHLRQHLTDRKFKCYECGLGFLQAEFLSRHLLTHSQENPFQCVECGKGFKQLVNLKQHQLRKHQKNEFSRRHLCSQCDKMFLTSSELKNHMVYHVKVRRFPCTACESSFLEKRHLDRHLRRIHSGIKNFFCNTCGKAFFEKFELNYHLRMSPCNLVEK